jgi:hypothetical protein
MTPEDLAADEFFRFMIWNDLSEEEADEKQISLKMGAGRFYLCFGPSCCFS